MNKTTRKIHRYITDYTLNNGHTPTYKQIMIGTGISSKSVVYRHIKHLENDYIVYWNDGVMMLTGFKRSISL